MFRTLRHAIIAANKSVLAIDEARLVPLVALGVSLARGMRVSNAEVAAVVAGEDDGPGAGAIERAVQLSRPSITQGPRGGNKTAVLSFCGLVNYDFEFQPYAVSTKNFARNMDMLTADDTVKNIVVLINSPGGMVTGLPEAADAMFRARQTKTVTAVVDPLAASAAYWIASQATEITCIPSGDVGSIGVRSMHMDCSEAMAQMGVKVTQIASGDFKTEGNMFEPLSEATKAYYQAESDAIYAQFIGAVARGRETTPTNVKANFGKGRVIRATDAKKLGMIDRLETSDAAFSRLGLLSVDGLAARRSEALESAPAEAAASEVASDQPAELVQEPSVTAAVQAVAAEPVEPVESAPVDPIAIEFELLRLAVEL